MGKETRGACSELAFPPDDDERNEEMSFMKFAGVIAGLLCIILTGCGTLLTINSGTSYGGVQADAGGIKNAFAQTPTEIMPQWAEGFLSLVDLPLSAITDTLALPYTIF